MHTRHISVNFHHILMQSILISRASRPPHPRRPDLIHIPAGLLCGGARDDKTGSICRAGKKHRKSNGSMAHRQRIRRRNMAGKAHHLSLCMGMRGRESMSALNLRLYCTYETGSRTGTCDRLLAKAQSNSQSMWCGTIYVWTLSLKCMY